MNALRFLAIAGLAGLAACQSGNPLDTSSGEDKAAALRAECDKALAQLVNQVEQAQDLVAEAEGTLVFPNVTSAGFVVGAGTGNGCLYQDGLVDSFYNTSAASFGLQAGAQSRSEVYVVTSEAAMDKLLSAAGLDLGGNVSAAVVDMGAGARVDTTTLTNNEVIAFIFGEQGLMANASIEGTKITQISLDSEGES
jgi:lipid-binding SYLF domain-containing protein